MLKTDSLSLGWKHAKKEWQQVIGLLWKEFRFFIISFNEMPKKRNEHEIFWVNDFYKPSKMYEEKKKTKNRKIPKQNRLAFICLLLLMEERAVSLDCCIYCYQINSSSVDFHLEMSIIKKLIVCKIDVKLGIMLSTRLARGVELSESDEALKIKCSVFVMLKIKGERNGYKSRISSILFPFIGCCALRGFFLTTNVIEIH